MQEQELSSYAIITENSCKMSQQSISDLFHQVGFYLQDQKVMAFKHYQTKNKKRKKVHWTIVTDPRELEIHTVKAYQSFLFEEICD